MGTEVSRKCVICVEVLWSTTIN